MTRTLLCLLVLTQSFLCLTARAAGPSWPQWRGPDRDATIKGGPAWPESLDGVGRTWRVELGPGYSGPIVAGDRVFVTETQKKKYEVVRALDRATGREIWRAKWKGSMSVPFFAKANGDWIRATPAYDGESLYVAGMRDLLVCLDAASGSEKWRVDFCKRYDTGLPAFGFVCSPMVVGDDLYVQAGASFCKLNKKTGETIWRTLVETGDMMDSAFSSPVMAELCGASQVVVQTRQKLCGVNPADGKVLWETVVPSFRGMNILTPTVYRNGIFTSTHKNATFFYQVSRDGGAWRVKEAWKHGAQGYMSSPVIIGNYIYCHLGNGRLACFDARSGEQTWRSKPFGKYWSMVANGTRVLALDERGDLVLFEASPEEFRILDTKHISDEECWGHIAVAGDEIFVRELGGISAFKWTGGAE